MVADGMKVANQLFLKWKIILNYLGGPVCHKLELEEGGGRGGSGEGWRSPTTEECGQLLEAGKMRK